MALGLGFLDEIFGIVGLADIYSLNSAKMLTLRFDGKHRKMPDFLLVLRRPIRGSHVVLLECKGSVLAGRAERQLRTACFSQLPNVLSVMGADARGLPRLAIAAELAPGAEACIHVDDPEEPVKVPAIDPLVANFLALEYALFGDLVSANRLWMAHGLRGFAGSAAEETFPAHAVLEHRDEAFTVLAPSRKLSARYSDEFELRSKERYGYAVTRIVAKASRRAMEMRDRGFWHDVNTGSEPTTRETLPMEVLRSEDYRHCEIREVTETAMGVSAEATITLGYDE